MYHLIAATASIAQDSELSITPIDDQVIPTQSNQFIPDVDTPVAFVYGLSTDLQYVLISSASIDATAQKFIKPVQPTLVGANDMNVCMMFNDPLMLAGREQFDILGYQDSAGNQQVTVGLLTGTPEPQEAAGETFTIKGTSSTAAVANTWSRITPTWSTKLASGTYAICGLDHISTNAQMARVVFPGSVEKPGVPSFTDENQRHPYPLSMNAMGEWGRFVSTNIPRIDVLCNGTDNSHTFYMYIKQVSRAILL